MQILSWNPLVHAACCSIYDVMNMIDCKLSGEICMPCVKKHLSKFPEDIPVLRSQLSMV